MTASHVALRLPADVEQSLSQWLTEPKFAAEREALSALVSRAGSGDAAARAEILDAFSQVLPIGTGGRRGKVGPGPNRFNKVVVRETAQGMVQALRAAGDTPQVAVVYDTRMHSRQFAYAVAEQCAAGGVTVVLLDAPRPTPELSFLVRRLGCGAGVVVSASHNPPEDNGIKIYGPDGAQVLGARDAALMRAILAVRELPELQEDQRALIHVLSPERVAAEADPPYHAYVLAQGVVPRSLADAGLKVVFTPLHGVGHTSALPAIRARGIAVTPVERQCDPDGGRFSTVKSANPEAPESMAMAVALAEETGSHLVLATDPDADRLGACVRGPGGKFVPLDGNRLGVLMLGHVLGNLRPLPQNGWVLTTLVTTPLLRTMCEAHGVEIVDDLLVGFKHHAGMAAEHPEKTVVFACEESHGYCRGDEIRDKDGAIAALLLAEAAALAHARGETLLDDLEAIWRRFGYHREKTLNFMAPGLAGRQAIAALMQAWRSQPPAGFAGFTTQRFEDRMQPRGTGSPTRDLPGDVLVLELASGEERCRLVLRPSGTEPKLKIYGMARSAPNVAAAALPAVQAHIDQVVDAVLQDALAQIRQAMLPFLEA